MVKIVRNPSGGMPGLFSGRQALRVEGQRNKAMRKRKATRSKALRVARKAAK